MIYRILVEIVLGFGTLAAGRVFWSVLKSGKFSRSLLKDATELSRIASTVGHERLINESRRVEPVLGDSYPYNIGLLLQSGITALDKLRNLSLLISAFFVGISVLLGFSFSVTSALLFFFAGFLPIDSYVKSSVAEDFIRVLTNLLKWNTVEPEACRKFCTVEKPWLKTLYEVALTLGQEGQAP